MTTLSRLVPYFGAKGRAEITRPIIDALGPHRAYWEPCCGGLGVLFAKPPCPMETINDLNGDLINLARVVADDRLWQVMYRRCVRTMMHETLFKEAAHMVRQPRTDDAPDVERAIAYYIVAWQGRSGVVGTKSYNHGFSARYTKNGGHAGTRWLTAVESIAAHHQRLRGVTIMQRDLFDLLERIEDAPGVAIYLDPPYVVKGASYLHDFEADDHAKLASAAQRFKRTRVVVSYYEHPLVRELYEGWRVREIEVGKSLVSASKRDGQNTTRATELVISNEPGGVVCMTDW